MQKVFRRVSCLTGVMVLVFGMSLSAMAQPTYDIAAPVVTLKTWQDSTENERAAFLIGFMSMVDIERAWQGEPGLSVAQSTTGMWVKGLKGVSLPQLIKSVSDYITANPGSMDESVLEVIGKIYVSPQLSKTEKKAASDRYSVIKHKL